MKLAKNTFAIKRYGKLMRFANWLQQIPNKVTPAPFRLIQIGSAFWQSRALYVGTKLEIADEIADSEKKYISNSKNLITKRRSSLSPDANVGFDRCFYRNITVYL